MLEDQKKRSHYVCGTAVVALLETDFFGVVEQKVFSRNTVLYRYRTVFFGENVCAREKPSKAFKSKDRKKITAKGQGKEEEKKPFARLFPKIFACDDNNTKFYALFSLSSFPPALLGEKFA